MLKYKCIGWNCLYDLLHGLAFERCRDIVGSVGKSEKS